LEASERALLEAKKFDLAAALDDASNGEASARSAQLEGLKVDNAAELGIDAHDMEVTLCYGNNNPSLKRAFCLNVPPTQGHGNAGFRSLFHGYYCHTYAHYVYLDAHWRGAGKAIYDESRNAYTDGKMCRPYDMTSKEILCYGNKYADIQKYLCGGTCSSGWHVALTAHHWIKYGQHEGGARVWGCTPDKEALCYGSRYSDLRSKFCTYVGWSNNVWHGHVCHTFIQGEKLRDYFNEYGVHASQQGLTFFPILAECASFFSIEPLKVPHFYIPVLKVPHPSYPRV